MDKRFDFSEIDKVLPTAEKMQEKDRMTDALENNYKAVCILSVNVERLENRLSDALPKMDGAVSSMREASTVTVSEEARQTLEQEGDAICRKIADRIDKEGTRLLDRLLMKDRVVISATAFWCLIEAVIFLLAAFFCTCMANARFIHDAMLWKILGCTAGFLIACITLTVLVCHKLKQ